MCDTYMIYVKKFKNSVLIYEISLLPLLNCIFDFVVMFSIGWERTARAAMMAVCSQPMRIEDVIRNPRGLNGRNTEVSPSLWDWQKFDYYSIFSF